MNTIDREDYPRSVELSGADVDAMVQGYLECQLWAGIDMYRSACECHADGDRGSCENPPLDENYSILDISAEYVNAVTEELIEVVAQHPLAVRMYLSARNVTLDWEGDNSAAFGHDFYLNREGHGAGFWDRGLGELGDYLSMVAHSYGSADELYDNGDGILRGQ